MPTLKFNNLPPNTQVRGSLYDDRDFRYLLGDVCEVELPNGIMIDVGWDDDETNPFHIIVYTECITGKIHDDFRLSEPKDVLESVRRLAWAYSDPNQK